MKKKKNTTDKSEHSRGKSKCIKLLAYRASNTSCMLRSCARPVKAVWDSLSLSLCGSFHRRNNSGEKIQGKSQTLPPFPQEPLVQRCELLSDLIVTRLPSSPAKQPALVLPWVSRTNQLGMTKTYRLFPYNTKRQRFLAWEFLQSHVSPNGLFHEFQD